MIVDFHTKQRFYWRTFLLQLEFYLFFSCLSNGLLLTVLFYFYYQRSNLKELTVLSNFSCKYMARIVTAIKTKQFTFIVKKITLFLPWWGHSPKMCDKTFRIRKRSKSVRPLVGLIDHYFSVIVETENNSNLP